MLGIENFGPYYKYTEINFSKDKTKNVTLITGDIGTGKTTLFQIFWWVLFPHEMEKEQEEEMEYLRTKEVINVVNEVAVRKARPDEKIKIMGIIKFNRRSSSGNVVDYTIKRERKYKKLREINSKESEIDKKEVLEYIKNSDKVEITKNGELIQFSEYLDLINEIFPKAIRKFAFIHGEGMTKILSIENIAELKKSVLSISDYPKINGLKKYFKICMDYFDGKREESHKNVKVLQDKRKDIEQQKGTLDSLNEKLKNKQEFQERFHDKILEINNELSLLDQNKEYIEKYQKLKEKIKNLEKKKIGDSHNKGLIKEREEKLLRYAPYIYLEQSIDLCLSNIKEKRNIGIIPGPNIPRRCLEIILNRKNSCICNNSWTEDMRRYIKELMKKSSNDVLIDSINKFEAYLIEQKKRIKEGKNDLYNIQRQLLNLNDQLNQQKEEINKYERNLTEEQKSEDTYKRMKELYEERDKITQKKTQNEHNIRELEEKIEEENSKLVQLQRDYSKLETERVKKKAAKDAFYYKDLYENLEKLEILRSKISNLIGNRIREETRKETEYNLIQLVKDPDKWQNITINDTKSGWEINAKFNDTIITNISTGMTNILGLSFIFALSSILGVDLPLVFDSPFGNLDAHTRQLITENLPPLFKGRQLIFLEKKINLLGKKDNQDIDLNELYPKLKKFVEYEYEITNPSYINAKIKILR